MRESTRRPRWSSGRIQKGGTGAELCCPVSSSGSFIVLSLFHPFVRCSSVQRCGHKGGHLVYTHECSSFPSIGISIGGPEKSKKFRKNLLAYPRIGHFT